MSSETLIIAKEKPQNLNSHELSLLSTRASKLIRKKKILKEETRKKIGDVILREFHLGYKRLCDLLSACQLTTYPASFVTKMVDSASFFSFL